MPLSDPDLIKFKGWLKNLLQREKITLTFTKKDGSLRTMYCTTNPTYIMFKDPSSIESKSDRKVNDNILPVYDLEADGWRSFRWDSIKIVSFKLGEENGNYIKAQ
jgi:WYL_2, Sm-like SH3 beta-barrel fold